MSPFLVLPIILPFATAVVILLARSGLKTSGNIALGSAALQLISCAAIFYRVHSHGICVLQVGDWPAPFGITLVADHLSAVMVVITAVINLAVVAYSRADIDATLVERGYYPLLEILVGGICGAFLTGDLFNLYVWFEVMLMASFALLVLGQDQRQLDGGVKYVVINLLSTLLLITAIGLLYGLTGTLNMADLHLKVQALDHQGVLTAVAMIFMAAFGIKAALFPLFFWLPASYHTPPVAVSAIFAGLLTKVGVYALIRTFTLIFTTHTAVTHSVLLVMAVLTMITGVLGAASQNEFRRILSFHIISQVGYMVLGLALNTSLALAGGIFYLVHHIIVKANLFLVSGVVRHLSGSFELARLGGLYRHHKWLAVLFFIPAFSLGGFPPLSGFWAKMILIRASLEIREYGVAAVAAAVGLLTVYSMSKIWGEAFWKPAPGETPEREVAATTRASGWMLTPIAALAVLTVVIGLGAEIFMEIAVRAAEELRHPEMYLKAVLGQR